MPRFREVPYPLVLVLLALCVCSGCSRSPLVGGDEVPDPEVEHANSGRTLSGVFSRTSPPGNVELVFTAAGDWTRTEASAAGTRSTAGSYLIDTDGALVLYVERVGDGQLTTARETVYDLDGDPAGRIELRDRAGGSETFERTGDEPPPAPPRAPGS